MKRQRPRKSQRASQTRYRFTKEDCQRGYQAALAKSSNDWQLYAWLYRRLRGHYRRKE